jgi:hypothetical protein
MYILDIPVWYILEYAPIKVSYLGHEFAPRGLTDIAQVLDALEGSSSKFLVWRDYMDALLGQC